MYTILCVDDRAHELAPALEHLGSLLPAEVTCVASFADAAALLEHKQFDAFILDIELSNSRHTGIQLADRIRSQSAHATTPIVFVSMYSHYSMRLLSAVNNSAFLSKPVHPNDLLYTVGAALGIATYVDRNRRYEPFVIPLSQGGFLEVDPKGISYIEVNRNQLTVQYIDGQTVRTKCAHGCFKALLDRIDEQSIAHLRQIYRSIIVNIDQIKTLEFNGNVGTVYLFGDPEPKPIGSLYKHNLKELL